MIRGRITTGEMPGEIAGTLDVSLRDVTLEGLATPAVASVSLPWPTGTTSTDFRLVTTIDPSAEYAIHAQLRRGDRLRRGDLVSKVRYPWRSGDDAPANIKLEVIV